MSSYSFTLDILIETDQFLQPSIENGTTNCTSSDLEICDIFDCLEVKIVFRYSEVQFKMATEHVGKRGGLRSE
jgi:hypothetical protein